MQGSGTFSVEAALASFIPRDGKTLVLMNGAYGQRAAKTLEYLGRDHVVLDKGDYLPPMPDEVDTILAADPGITDVVLIHCETSSGILNPLKGISDVVGRQGRRLIVDAMSSFGAGPLDAGEVSSPLADTGGWAGALRGYGFFSQQVYRRGARLRLHHCQEYRP